MGTPFTATAPAADDTIPASENQISFVKDLLNTRKWNDVDALPAKHISRAAALNLVIGWVTCATEVPVEVRKYIDAGATDGENVNALLAASLPTATPGTEYIWAPLTRRGASALIEWLKGLPTQVNVRIDDRRYEDAAVEVPAGRYAIDTQVHAVNGTAFYKVDRPTEGRWAGYVFVKQQISSEERKLSMKQGRAILSRIAAVGAEAASARYGRELEHCGVCGRPLTNDDSRERGIGPKCAADLGW